MGAANKSYIVLGTNGLEITRMPIANNATEIIPYANISGVVPVKIQSNPNIANDNNWNYRFNTMVIVDIKINDGTNFQFDLQEVGNQGTWTANLAGQQNCIAAINAVL